MRYAVIPTRNRQADLRACLDSLHGQVDHVIIIDNGTEPPLQGRDYRYGGMAVIIIRDSEQPPNLSRLWNVGIKATQRIEGWEGPVDDTPVYEAGYHIAIINDDTIIPPGWMDTIVEKMERWQASAGCISPHVHGEPKLSRRPPISVFDRLVGWAFVLNGWDGILANEELRWWYGDNDLDMKARQLGGTLLMPGQPPLNRYANSTTTGILAEQAGRDRATFEAIYGPVPW